MRDRTDGKEVRRVMTAQVDHYERPGAFLRFTNRLILRWSPPGVETLLVRGRRSGVMQRVPVIPLDYLGSRYLVSSRGQSEWVRNLRSAGTGELHGRKAIVRFSAAELPVSERQPIIDSYVTKLGRSVRRHFERAPDAGDHPVFRIDG